MEINKNDQVDSNNNWIKKWLYQDSKDLEAELKNNMLVVATLIVAVTFQTGISPPGGAWQGTEGGHEAGKAIMASLNVSYHMFLILNTLAFSISTQLILILVYHKKFYFEIVVATVSMVAIRPQFPWWQLMARRFGHSLLIKMSSFVM
ncbi:hypothetical protein LWI29_013933 [Acer saccharum]|uniref:PGG domain-containing protein n=1 Tax=Acer saccharum TaxID=4024 RepID=A0AA39RZH8_ACESA|nr:hypothetical protein LWI29_013933 [Acer saccharum]